jgi:hypothetical protein
MHSKSLQEQAVLQLALLVFNLVVLLLLTCSEGWWRLA